MPPGRPKGIPKTGGRQKGAKNKITLDKELRLSVLRDMVSRELEPMVRAQIQHCLGIDHFFMRDPETGQWERITDPTAIQTALNAGDRDSYYWIFSKDPSVQAFTDLMNRTFGKPPERIEHSGPDGKDLQIVVKKPW